MKKILKLFVMLTTCILLAGSVYAEDEAFLFSEMGDVNGDSSFTEEDLICLTGYMQTNALIKEENADLSSDGKINVIDVMLLKNVFLDSKEIMLSAEKKSVVSEDDEVQCFTYTLGDEEYNAYFDSVENEVFDKLNDFREKYGVRKSQLYYRGLYLADETSKIYNEYTRNSDASQAIHSFMANNMPYYSINSFVCTSDNPEVVVEAFLASSVNKSIVLRADYNLSVGHYGNRWVIGMIL